MPYNDPHNTGRPSYYLSRRVSALLAPEKDIEVVAKTTNRAELIQLIDDTVANVILVDAAFEDNRGIEVTRSIKRVYPQVHVLGFSMVDRKETMIGMLKAEASGFLLKSADKEDLLEAIRAVASGNNYLTHELSGWLLHQLHPTGRSSLQSGDALTAREREILQLIAEEYSNPEIAEKLFISPRTVDTHRRHLLNKIGAKNTAGLVKYAFQQGLLSWDVPRITDTLRLSFLLLLPTYKSSG